MKMIEADHPQVVQSTPIGGRMTSSKASCGRWRIYEIPARLHCAKGIRAV